MGLLAEGRPLDWEESKKYHEYVKQHGIEQFVNLYRKRAGKTGSILRWGDEVEYFICSMDDKTKTAKLPLRAPEILHQLAEARQTSEEAKEIIWHPEYANWMLEATPGKPYGEKLENLLDVEANMVLRRQYIQKFLLPGEQLFTMTCFPRMGTEGFTVPAHPTGHAASGGISNSIYIPDEAINPHPRFPTLTANIRKRRGEKVMISVPVYQDTHTAETMRRQREHAAAVAGADLPPLADDAIYMDCMAFGMGAGCLQVTFQASDVEEARLLYDQLAVVAPLMLALTAATPIWKGTLADTDARWDVISASVDDRDPAERGLLPPAAAAAAGRQRLAKSRYSSIDTYISQSALLDDAVHNDVACAVDPAAAARLAAAGVDARLARHVAHLFVRDPLVVFEDRLQLDDEADTEHFESLQSTNWNTVRFKPPPAGSPDIHWRVEFRSMELSLTDYENAAHTVFIMLLSRAILALGLNLYMPISKVDDNMARAHRRGAAATGRFWARRTAAGDADRPAAAADVVEMSMGEVFNGDGRGYAGLVGLVGQYLDSVGCAGAVRARLDGYLALVARRAAGAVPTTAAWMRSFVLGHPAYRGDSDVPEAVCYDLLKACAAVSAGGAAAEVLLGAAAAAAGGAAEGGADEAAVVAGREGPAAAAREWCCAAGCCAAAQAECAGVGAGLFEPRCCAPCGC